MANQVSLEESSDPIEYNKKLVLKVSIDCEGCRKKVNKIITKVLGVEKVDIDMKQQKVTVIGDVDAFYLLKKLKKSGRQVDLLPEIKPDQKKEPSTEKKKSGNKSKDKEKEPKLDVKGDTSRISTGGENSGGINNVKFAAAETPQPQVKVKSPKELAKSTQTSSDGGSESAPKPVHEEKSDISMAEENQNSDPLEKELKPEKKDTENGSQPSAAEKEEVDVVENNIATTKKVDSGNIGKKKKKKGQNGNNNEGRVPSTLSDVTADHGIRTPPIYSLPANHVHPRDNGSYYAYERDLYSSPPVYAASYNTSYSSNYATTSYYTALPADSYVHAYSGGGGGFERREISPPPSDVVEAYTRQPLDSLEMFSDENPNGCLIM